MSGPEPERFREFDAKLRQARASRPAASEREAAEPPRFGGGLQAGIDVVAGVIAGVLIGWALDRWLGTSPFLLIAFLFVGAAAGLRNAYRTMLRLMAEGDQR